MKELLISLTTVLLFTIHLFANKPPKIDESLLRNFAIQFPHAQEVVWHEQEDAYVVSFVEDGIRLKIVYLRNGNLTHYLRYYLEETLPLDIRLNVKKKFPGKEIYGVVEENIVYNVEGKARTIYYVKLHDESSWLTIKAERNKKPKVVERLIKDI